MLEGDLLQTILKKPVKFFPCEAQRHSASGTLASTTSHTAATEPMFMALKGCPGSPA